MKVGMIVNTILMAVPPEFSTFSMPAKFLYPTKGFSLAMT